MTKNEFKMLLASYFRSILGAATALYAAGITDLETLAWALLGAVVPVFLRALNPNDPAFGKLPTAVAVDAAVKAAKTKKEE